MVLPQVGMPDLVDSPRKALPALRSGWSGKGEAIGGREKANEEKLG